MLSVLRVGGIVFGVLMVAVGARRLVRTHTGSRIPALLQMGAGAAVIAVSIAPELASPIRDLLGLTGESPGRLIALLVVSVGLSYPLIFFALNRADRASRRTDALVRALALTGGVNAAPPAAADELLVCLPAHNEAENLPDVLEAIPRRVAGRRTRVLVVDDGSSDETRSVAVQHGAWVVRHELRLGGGGALRTGYAAAAAAGFEMLVTLDADGQHDPAELSRLVAPLIGGEADFVLGSRRRGTAEADSPVRRIGIGVYTALINIVGRMQLTDVSNGYRAVRIPRIVGLHLTEEQFHNAELLLAVHRARLRLVEVPVTVRRRGAGKSKKGTNLRYGLGFLRVLLRSWLR